MIQNPFKFLDSYNKEDITRALPRNRRLKEEDVAFCMAEFERIKVLRWLAEE